MWDVGGGSSAPAGQRRRYLHIVSSKRFSMAMVALAAIVPAAALTAATTLATPAPAKTSKPLSEHALLSSHELWATIDVCDPADEPNTVGVRGSMPGDGQAHDKMYMSFRLQYMNASKQWVNLASGASSGFVAVGAGASARQGGTTFDLKPVTGQPPVTLRGVVDFQWRRGKTVVLSAARPTLAGHKSLAGADPASFSAATCVIG
jgi:hypothetical protein